MRHRLALSVGLSTLLLASGASAQIGTFGGSAIQAPVVPGGLSGIGARGALNPAPSGILGTPVGGLSAPGTPLAAPFTTPGSAFGPALGIMGPGGTTLVSPNNPAGRTTSAFGTPLSNMTDGSAAGAFGSGFGAATTTAPVSVLAVPSGGIASPSAILQSMGLLPGAPAGALGLAPMGAFPLTGSGVGATGVPGTAVGAFGIPVPVGVPATAGGFGTGLTGGGTVIGGTTAGQGRSLGLQGGPRRTERSHREEGDGWRHMRSLY